MTRILLVGCGKMGGALLAGWLDQGIAASDMVVVDPHFSQPAPPGLRVFADSAALPESFHPDLVLLAVKPQAMDAVLPAYRHLTGAVFLLIAAGRSLDSLAALLGNDAAIVRAMPNTPAMVRRGITALLANDEASAPQRQICDDLMSAVGDIVWIDDEIQMDAVTALSGSGPAYVFLLVDSLAAAGKKLGLSSELAQKLARSTIVGSAELLRQSPQSATELRENVTSPNGTTFAALQVLMQPSGLPDLFEKALAAAAKRARELA